MRSQPDLADELLLSFAMRLLDVKAKLLIENSAARLPTDHVFTNIQMDVLKADVRDAALRNCAARALMLKHLEEFGATACAPLLKRFKSICTNAAMRNEIAARYADGDAKLGDDQLRVFRIEGVDLNLHIFHPKRSGTRSKPAILFIFGGGWYLGKPEQFFGCCEYLARKGFVALTSDHRTRGRNNVTPEEGLKDVKSAVRYIRTHTQELGIDPDRLCVCGWSSGGQLALALDSIREFNHADDDMTISCRPNAIFALAPGLDITTQSWFAYVNRGGATAKRQSPLHHIRKGLAPTHILIGANDAAIEHDVLRDFQRRMRRFGNKCGLEIIANAGHTDLFTTRTCRRIIDFLAAQTQFGN